MRKDYWHDAKRAGQGGWSCCKRASLAEISSGSGDSNRQKWSILINQRGKNKAHSSFPTETLCEIGWDPASYQSRIHVGLDFRMSAVGRRASQALACGRLGVGRSFSSALTILRTPKGFHRGASKSFPLLKIPRLWMLAGRMLKIGSQQLSRCI